MITPSMYNGARSISNLTKLQTKQIDQQRKKQTRGLGGSHGTGLHVFQWGGVFYFWVDESEFRKASSHFNSTHHDYYFYYSDRRALFDIVATKLWLADLLPLTFDLDLHLDLTVSQAMTLTITLGKGATVVSPKIITDRDAIRLLYTVSFL